MVLTVLFFIFCIVDAGAFDGFVRVNMLYEHGHPFPGTMGLFQSMIYLCVCFLNVYTTLLAHYQKK
jgi:hypothetical protein